MEHRWTVRVSILGVLLVALTACQPADPADAVLKERARWTVTPKGFVETDDGRIKLSLGVSGPSRSSLKQLSFRVDLRDASGRSVASEWRTIDLAAIPLGAGTDVSLTITRPAADFAEISIDRALNPGPDETPRIKELQF